MNPGTTSSGWSVTRMGMLAALLTAVQFAVVVNLGRVPDAPPRVITGPAQTMLVLEEGLVEEVFAGVPRSRLDVLAQGRNDAFQAVALGALPKAQYRLAEWREPTRWLTNPVALPPVRVPLVTAASRELSAARPALPASEVRGLVSTQTLLEVTGKAATRAWKEAPVLGPWTGSEVLGATRLDVAVNPQGWVVLIQVAESSGSKVADDVARQAVRQSLFHPVPGAKRRPEFGSTNLDWVSVAVQWSTQPALR